MTIFIAPRVSYRTSSEIMADIEAATDAVKKIFSSEGVDTVYTIPSGQGTLLYLSKVLASLNLAEAVYFCFGWEEDFICKILHEICEQMGIQRFEE